MKRDELLAEKILETSLKTCQLTQEAPVLVGVSGGPDSLCLLDVLARLRFPVIAAHFDHRLRPDSGRDGELVRAFAGQIGAPFVLGSGDVSAFAQVERLSLEEAARELRYRFLFEQARSGGAQAVAVAHTADDQVETVLMHLLRGAGLSGLKGMIFRTILAQWNACIPLVRPLLGVWRDETLGYCQERGLRPVLDPTNQDVTFFRNRLRHELIPLLETYNPQARQNLWRTAQALAGDEAIVQAAVQAAWEACLDQSGGDFVALRRQDFCALPPGLQRGVLRRAVAHIDASLRDVDFAAVERALRFAHTPGSGQVDLVRGLRLAAESERLLVDRGASPADPAWPRWEAREQPLPIPGEVDLGAGWRLVIERVEKGVLPVFPTAATTAGSGSAARSSPAASSSKADSSSRAASSTAASPWEAWLDAAALSGGLYLRCALPGDRFQPLGMEGHSLKLADFWINQKLPRRARAAWPLVTDGKNIVWVPGFRLAHPFRVQEATRQALHLRMYKAGTVYVPWPCISPPLPGP